MVAEPHIIQANRTANGVGMGAALRRSTVIAVGLHVRYQRELADSQRPSTAASPTRRTRQRHEPAPRPFMVANLDPVDRQPVLDNRCRYLNSDLRKLRGPGAVVCDQFDAASSS